MKRQIGTVLSVVGLLAVGGGAAVLNAHVLHSGGGDPGRIAVSTLGGLTMMNATTGLPSPEAPPAANTTSGAQVPGPAVSALDSSSATPGDSATAGVEGSMMDRWRDRALPGNGMRMMPRLTPDQRNLLRIAAMARVSPRDVLDAARGLPIPANDLASIRAVAAYIGVDLKSLADVSSLPRMLDRGHGGPNDHGGMNFDN